jgi:hypothetical protein
MDTPVTPLRQAALLALAGAFVASACGPSISSVYEGNIRFEHCYRLDMDPKIATSHRQACWEEWMHRYTYGQTRDRLEYARRRVKAIQSGDPERSELNLNESPDAATNAPPEAPVPTSVHRPPPPTVLPPPPPPEATDAGADADAAPEAGGPPPPGAQCVKDCGPPWGECHQKCSGDAGAKSWQCKACDLDYRRCVQRCLK